MIDFIRVNIVYIAIIATLLAIFIFGIYIIMNMKKIPNMEQVKYKFTDPDEALSVRVAQSLSDAIKIPTTNDDGIENIKKLHRLLEDRYPNIHKTMEKEVINEGSLLYKLKGNSNDKDAIILCGHLDVVSASGEWKYPAFSGDIQEGRIWGRGTLDCKNVVIGVMEAMETLISKGHIFTRDVYIAFGHDEEIGGSLGAKEIARILEQRNVRAEVLLDEGGHITKQFMGQNYCTLATINVAEKGYLDIKLIAKDAGGHSSTPPKHTGLGRIAEAICRIEASPMKPAFTPVTQEYFTKIAPLMDSKYKVLIANQKVFKKPLFRYLSKNLKFKASTRTTFAATMANGSKAANILPIDASAVINIRILPGNTSEQVIKHIKGIVEPLGIKTEILSVSEPQGSGEYKSRMFLSIEESIKHRFGDSVVITPGLMLGATDSKYYENIAENIFRFMPFVIKPSDSASMHTVNESIPIYSFAAGVEFYIEFIEKITKPLNII